MSFSDRVAARLEASPIARRLEALGAFSPQATLRTFSPGAQSLLAGAEREAERGLHVARGAVVVVLVLTIGIVLGGWRFVPTPVVLAMPVVLVAAWLAVWRLLSRPHLPAWLPYGLIVFDTLAAVRGAILVDTPMYRNLGLEALLSPDDLLTLSVATLVVVAMTGAYRLNPFLAGFSTLCAVVGFIYVASVLEVSSTQALAVGAIIWFAGALGAQAARIFRHFALKAREQAVLERYVPEALTRELARTGDPTGAGREVDITVLIVDIRGYTRRTERLTPRESVAFLNDYFAIVVAPLAAHGAVLDKYVGDGVFTFFEGDDHQLRAMQSAREILAAVDRHNEARKSGEPLAIGIAIHSGTALVGTIGAEQKREYTAIADAVNVTARLEELNKHFGSAIVVSETVIAAIGPEHADGFRGPELTPIRGHDASIEVRYLPAGA